jgi:hypothetical protein
MNHVHFQQRLEFVRTLLQGRFSVEVSVTVLFVTRQNYTLTLTGCGCQAYRIRGRVSFRL